METFTTIKFELRTVLGIWMDITADVLINPQPTVTGMGIMSSGILDRVGDAATLTFSLNNSSGNSAGLLGYYSPRHDNFFGTPQTQVTGLAVRLYFEYNGIRRYKFFGRIVPDGWKVIAGMYAERRVDVTAVNWMHQAAEHTLELMGYQQNKRIEQGVQLVINNMARQPQNIQFDTGVVTFPTLFDLARTTSKSLSEFQKFAISEFGRIYTTGDGTNGETLRVEKYSARSDMPDSEETAGAYIPVKMSDVTDSLLLQSGDHLLLQGGGRLLLNNRQRASFTEADIKAVTVQYSKNMFNEADVKLYPRTIDAAATTVLWSLSEPITLGIGEQITDYRGAYRDPTNPDTKVNGIEMVTPVATTDYQMFANADGTGTDYTSSLGIIAEYGTAEVKYTLTNNSGAIAYVTTLQARGKGVYVYDPTIKTFSYGAFADTGKSKISITIDQPYAASLDALPDLFNDNTFMADFAVDDPHFDTVTFDVNKSSKAMLAFMCLEPGRSMLLTESVSGIGVDFYTPAQGVVSWFINGYDFKIIDGKFVEWTCVLKRSGEQ